MEGYHRYYDRDSGRWITALDCPQCARFRDKLDREKMADVLKVALPIDMDEVCLNEIADALIKYLTE